LHHGLEPDGIDRGHHAAELEDDAALQTLCQPRHQLERLLAADQTKIADYPGALALLRPVGRRRPVGCGDRRMRLVLEQEPRAVVLLDRRVVATVEARRGQDQYLNVAQAEPLDSAQ